MKYLLIWFELENITLGSYILLVYIWDQNLDELIRIRDFPRKNRCGYFLHSFFVKILLEECNQHS